MLSGTGRWLPVVRRAVALSLDEREKPGFLLAQRRSPALR